MFCAWCFVLLLFRTVLNELSMIGGRSGNRGECAQPCGLPYRVENRKSADLMSLEDLCTIDMIPEHC